MAGLFYWGGVLKDTFSSPWPQVLENCLVLGSRTALFFEWLKFCRSAEKCFSRPFFLEIDKKKFYDLFSQENTCICVLGPWPQAFLSLALASDFFCVCGHGLEPRVLDSTSVILCSHYLVTFFEMQHYFENIYYYVICSLVLQVLDSL